MSSSVEPRFVIAWYSEEEWNRLKLVAADSHKLDDTYEDWRKNVRELIETLKLNETRYIKYFVSVEKLEAWCKNHSRPNNSEARAEFVTECARSESS